MNKEYEVTENNDAVMKRKVNPRLLSNKQETLK